MKIGIISDTHDQIENIKKAIDIFNKEKVSVVYHLGDICSPFVLHLFEELKCKIKAVFGNNDSDVFKHLKYKPDNFSFHDKFISENIKGKNLCCFHGDPTEIISNLVGSGKYDIILTGHNHVAEIKRSERTLMINPGNLVGPFSKLTEFWTEPSIALYDFKSDEAQIIKI